MENSMKKNSFTEKQIIFVLKLPFACSGIWREVWRQPDDIHISTWRLQ